MLLVCGRLLVRDIFISLVLAAAVSSSALARDAKPRLRTPQAAPKKKPLLVECKERLWKGSADTPLKDIKIALDQMPRAEVIQLAWGESTQPAPKSMALPVLAYLAGTEDERAVRGYFKSMIYALTDGRKSQDLLSQWPARQGLRPFNLTLHEQCAIFEELTQ